MNILVTLDRNYLRPLLVMLTSLLLNNPNERFHIFLATDDLTENDLSFVRHLLRRFNSTLHVIYVEDDWFSNAPTIRYYSRAMYYRLLAAQMLPPDLERILYLDPDMLVINPIRALYDTPMNSETLYAACTHEGLVNISSPVNKLRLSSYETEDYFNSGMLLMNLPAIRQYVHPCDIFAYAEKHRQLLVLPDQDILNGLYGNRILPLDEGLWNYDTRRYREYLISSSGERNMSWVMKHTAILHYCGKKKPWHKSNSGRFTVLYKHYMQLANRLY